MNQDLLLQSHQLREVRLYGHLAKQFGRVHHLSVSSCREAAQALAAVLPGFEAALLAHESGYNVFAGQRGRDGEVIAERLDAPLGQGEAVCIVPVVAGSKRGGLFQILLGAAILAFAPYAAGALFGAGTSFGTSAAIFIGNYGAQIGLGLILGGVVKALTPSQKGGSGSNAQNEPSYHFNGPSNTSTQGSAVPVVYGRMIVGSMVISQGMSSEEYVNASTTPVDNGTSILPTTWMPKYVYRG